MKNLMMAVVRRTEPSWNEKLDDGGCAAHRAIMEMKNLMMAVVQRTEPSWK
ncbi:MAG: hypothetical protein H6641_23070 [Caldilineaceae bacterium]|nr:hypothetical protein [Caldilineaceae bacterium]